MQKKIINNKYFENIGPILNYLSIVPILQMKVIVNIFKARYLKCYK